MYIKYVLGVEEIKSINKHSLAMKKLEAQWGSPI